MPDEVEEWWTAEDCATYLRITVETWRYYWSRRVPKRHPAPLPGRRFGVTPVWRPEVVRVWDGQRPGRGRWRADG